MCLQVKIIAISIGDSSSHCPPGFYTFAMHYQSSDFKGLLHYTNTIQWSLSYQNPLRSGVVHNSEKSISLKLCMQKQP